MLRDGASVYSNGLAGAVAEAGVRVDALAFDAGGTEAAVGGSKLSRAVNWHLVAAPRTPPWRTHMDSLPFISSSVNVPAMTARFDALVAQLRPDAVVIDNYAAGWALARLGTSLPVVYIAHNAEGRLAADIARGYRGRTRRRIALHLNAFKTQRLERQILQRAALTVAITETDRALLGRWTRPADMLVCTPGYDDPGEPPAELTAQTPRRVAMLGSMAWLPKQQNTRAFLDEADARFAEAGIETVVIGGAPPAFLEQLRGYTRSTQVLGFVEDPLPVLHACRLGVSAEAIGGGFKLKSLDYLFAGLPICAVEGSLEGLPDELAATPLYAADMAGLVDRVIAVIDDLPTLNARRATALAAARRAFAWRDRGEAIAAALAARI